MQLFIPRASTAASLSATAQRSIRILLSTTQLLPCLVVSDRFLLQGGRLQVSRVDVLGKKSQKKTVRPEGHQHKGSSVLLLPSPGSHRLSLCPTECFWVFCTRFPFDSQQNCCPHLHARCAQTEAMSLHPPLPAATENPKSTQLSVTSPQSTRRCRQTTTTQKHRSTNTPHLTFKMYQ